MDTASLEFFAPVLDGIDNWSEVATILPVLVARENPMTDSNGELDLTLSINYFIGFNFGIL